ncbi:carboxymuconolactone decarboxylase family protein [Virgibacillus byunsanensis]|uniref:Carboxymuconolactone decarboxylase family protein n=1 Tax=Virgibacillus byunsanensis TaxID=570945 RepID=A0ABW3LG76_9BACI
MPDLFLILLGSECKYFLKFTKFIILVLTEYCGLYTMFNIIKNTNKVGVCMENNFEKGLKVRRSVLGEDYVNKSLNNATDFNRPMQQLVTEYCWGEIWTRPGLEKKTRSLLNLAILTALNRPHEFKTHTTGALRNGCTPEEIQEVLLQCAIYVGVPAAVDSFRTANEIISEHLQENNT